MPNKYTLCITKNGKTKEIAVNTSSLLINNDAEDLFVADTNVGTEAILTKEQLSFLGNPHLQPLNRCYFEQSFNAISKINGEKYKELTLTIDGVTRRKDGTAKLKLYQVNPTLQWLEEMEDCFLCELDYGSFTWTSQNIINHLNSAYPYSTSPFYFSMINYGQRIENNCFYVTEFEPVFYIEAILNRGFKKLGFRLVSEFLEKYGKYLVVNMPNCRLFEKTTDVNAYTTQSEFVSVGFGVEENSTTVIFDTQQTANGNYDPTTGIYTAGVTGNYVFDFCVYIQQQDLTAMNIEFIKNKGTVDEEIVWGANYDFCAVLDIPLLAGDQLCLIATGFTNELSAGSFQILEDSVFFVETYDGIVDGQPYDMSRFIDCDLTLGGLLRGIAKEFNLVAIEGETSNQIRLEPKYTTEIIDPITGEVLECKGIYELDKSLDITDLLSGEDIKYTTNTRNKNKTRSITYCYKEDENDTLVEQFKETNGYQFLSNRVILNTKGKTDKECCNEFFAPTKMIYDTSVGQTILVPAMWNSSNPISEVFFYSRNQQPSRSYKFCPRLFINYGMQPVLGSSGYGLCSDTGVSEQTQYPLIASYNPQQPNNEIIGYGLANYPQGNYKYYDTDIKEQMQSLPISLSISPTVKDFKTIIAKRNNYFTLGKQFNNTPFRLSQLNFDIKTCNKGTIKLMPHYFKNDICYEQQYEINCDEVAANFVVRFNEDATQFCVSAYGMGTIESSFDGVTYTANNTICVPTTPLPISLYFRQIYLDCPVVEKTVTIYDEFGNYTFGEVPVLPPCETGCNGCAIEVEFADPTNTPMYDADDCTHLANWQTRFEANSLGLPFENITGVQIVGNIVRLCGGDNLKVVNSAFRDYGIISFVDNCDGIVEFGGFAFVNSNLSDNTDLINVELSGLLEINGFSNWRGCVALTNFDAPSLTTAGGANWLGCTALVNFTAPNLTTVVSDNWRGCTSLVNFTAPSLMTVADQNWRDCTSLVNFIAPSLTSVADRNWVNCTALVNFTAPILTTVETGNWRGCTALTNFDAPSLTTVGIQNWQNCTSLTYLDISACTQIGTSPHPNTIDSQNFFNANNANLTIKINPVFNLTAPTGSGDLDFHLAQGGTLIY